MKPEEALKYLKDFIDNEKPQIGAYNTEVLKKAIGALEKQVHKKIEYVSDGDAEDSLVLEYRCPVCEEELYRCNDFAYCPYCGQAIDWEED